MKSPNQSVALILVILSVAPFHAAADQPLIPGDQAPKIVAEQWLHGQAPTLGAGRVCVVDFGASWCPTCRQVLLDRVAARDQFPENQVDFVFISDEIIGSLNAFVLKFPSPLPVAVASDLRQTVLRNIFGDVDDHNFPLAVVIDADGRVAWRGVPNPDFNSILQDVVDQTWDTDQQRRWALAERELDQLMTEGFSALNADDCAKMIEIGERVIDIQLGPDSLPSRAAFLNAVAWELVTEPPCSDNIDRRALHLAERAVADSNHDDPAIIDTLARALYELGDLAGAIEQQKLAVEKAGDSPFAQNAQATLDKYMGKQDPPPANDEPKPAQPPAEKQTEQKTEPEKPANEFPASITRAQALEDIDNLRANLAELYAGYDDLAWDMRCEGTSWEEHTQAFKKRIEQREQWPIRDFFALLQQYLDRFNDSHALLVGPKNEDGSEREYARLVKPYVVYFAPLRLAKSGQKFLVVEAPDRPDLVGLGVPELSVASIHNARHMQPMLFPTVPRPGEKESCLLGMFCEQAPDADIPFIFRKPDGQNCQIPLPLHRSGARLANAQSDETPRWETKSPPDVPFPAVCVRTCVIEQIEGDLAASADSLRQNPVAVLDLRGNGGGADDPAIDWCSRFSKQRFRWWPGAMRRHGQSAPYDRWQCFLGSTHDQRPGAPENPAQPDYYDGRLFILADRGVASSGETFLSLAAQIPGAVVLGENSMGCMTYGNCNIVIGLPHSRCLLRFGWVKFMQAAVSPIAEGVGQMPDYWLDDLDPYQAVQMLIRSEQSKS